MNHINTWKIYNNLYETENNELNILLNRICEKCPETLFILDKSKKSIIEILINDIVEYHKRRLNITDEIFVEFWFKTKSTESNNFHLDCDERQKMNNIHIQPFLSCITYLNDNNANPTIITEVDSEKYNNAKFESSLYFSLPRKMKHISFDGGNYYHSTTKISLDDEPRNILVFNLWKSQPLNVPLFDLNHYIRCSNSDLDSSFSHVEFLLQNDDSFLTVQTNLITATFVKNLLFDKQNCILLKDIFDKYHTYDNIYFHKAPYINNYIDLKDDKFIQRFIKEKFFTKEICNWIIDESEKYALNHGWTTTRHLNYPTTDIPANLLPVYSFLLYCFNQSISKQIIEKYSLHEECEFKLIDTFIVKYESNAQNFLGIHEDEGCISANILLSDTNDFKGGGTYFVDGITTKLNQGDMLLHCSKTKHSGIKITEGKRYLVVFFIDIKNYIEPKLPTFKHEFKERNLALYD